MTKHLLKTFVAFVAIAAMAIGPAGAQTTHVVTQATVNNIFSGDGSTLGAAVSAGDILDFQGTIDIDHSLIVNKQVTIKSTTKDAVVKLHTPTNVMPSAYTATVMYPQSFVINADGSGTTVQDIRLENTGTWLHNTSNVTFTGVTIWVENSGLCAGVGQVAIRYSDHVTFDSCTFYAKGNGGTSFCALTGSHDCTFRNSRIEKEGNVGNILHIGNSYNTADKPADYTINNDNISVLNCTITAESSGGLSYFKIEGGLRHRIENCTVNYNTSFGCVATASEDGIVFRNNTFKQGLSIPRASTVTGNNVIGNVTIGANYATVSGTTVFPGSTIDSNNIAGKVTFNSNSKNNTFTHNTVITTEQYAVVMASTANANNTVTGNILKAAAKGGDEAVNPSTGTGNTISNNLSEAAAGDVTWNFDATTGMLTIGGTGAMADYDQTTAPWAFLSDQITRVVIDEEVTAIGNNAFSGCTALNDVFVKSDNVPTIGSNAFNASAPIYVPQGMGAAYQQAWTDYANRIGEFMSCGAGAMAVYDATTHTLTICGTGAMADFASASDQPWASLQGQIQQVVVEGTITAIGTNAFNGCSALTAATLEGTGTTIADGAFNGNATGRRIFVPAAAIAGYGESTYATDIYATGLCGATGSEESITWELNAATKALVISGTGAMFDFSTTNMPWFPVRANITSITIEPGVTTIGNSSFYGCSSMASVSLPEGLTTLGSSAFQNCTGLVSVSLPEGLTTIGNSSFYGCSSMASVSLPEGLTTIGSNAFEGCSSLDTVVLPSGVTTLGSSAFRNCSGLTTVNIPAGVISINGSTFYGCSSLASVSLPEGLTSIGSGAFFGCSSLDTVVLPSSVTTLGSSAFYDCTGLVSVNIPAGVTEIGSSAFRGCTSLTTVDISAGVAIIGLNAFRECAGLTTVSLPASVTEIGSYAFRDCSNLASVCIFAPSLSTYGSNAFNGNAAGRKIYVPAASVDTYKSGWSAYQNDILPMSFHTVRLAAGTVDSALWTLTPADTVIAGQPLTATYSGTRKVKSVKAVKYVVPPTLLDNTTTAWADGRYAVPAGGLTYSDAITVSGNVTLALTDGTTLTLNKGIILADGATLTIQGNGTMNVNGTNENTTSTVAGSTGTLILTSGTLTATGGNGGSFGDFTDDSHGGNGGVAINGSVIVSGGTLTARGGNGGSVGDYCENCSGGNGGDAISGTLTINGGSTSVNNGSNGSIGDYCGDCTAGAGGQAVAGTVTDNR